MNLSDLILILFIILFVVLGIRAGFKKSLISFIGFAVSLIITILLAAVATRALLTLDGFSSLVAGRDGSFFAFFYRHLLNSLDYISIEYLRAAYNYGGADAVDYVFLGGGFDPTSIFMLVVYPLVRSAAVSPVMLNSTMGTARELFALELSYGLAVFLVGVAMFIVLRIIVACISIVLRKKSANRAALKAAARLGGGLIGLARGALYAGIILMVLSLMAGFSFMNAPMRNIEESMFVGNLANGANTVSELVIRSAPDHDRFEMLLLAAGFEVV